jgi:hypothetical protein
MYRDGAAHALLDEPNIMAPRVGPRICDRMSSTMVKIGRRSSVD